MKECKKCKSIELIVKEWINKQGHNSCWYYPELFNEIIRILDISQEIEKGLPARNEFEKGCTQYQNEEYNKI